MSFYISYENTESDQRHTLKYTKKTVQKSFIPLIHTIIKHYEKSQTKPYTLAVVGPPGCGKSAISSLFKILLEEQGKETYVLPLDGFHFKDEELKKMKAVQRDRLTASLTAPLTATKTAPLTATKTAPLTSLYEKKGAKETYQVERLIDLMAELKSGKNLHWPLYSRSTHNPVEKGIFIDNKDAIYIVEGNYLFLDFKPWNTLRKYFNRKIFISSKKKFLRRRIIQRKHRGGFSRAYARKHYRDCDSINIDEVLGFSSGYDCLLIQRGAHRYTLSSL